MLEFETEYMLERSRNKGQFWSRLNNARTYKNLDDAVEAYTFEHNAHPSDWLRIIRIEHHVEMECHGTKSSCV